jgi:drug/metabolite transporter (DMT)-like permease
MIRPFRRIWDAPYLLLPLPPLFWALNLLIGRAFAQNLPPIGLTFWRWVGASVCLLPFIWRDLVRDWPILRRHLPLVTGAGMAGFIGYPLLNYIALHSVPAATAAILNSAMPLVTPLLAWPILRQRPSRQILMGAPISVVGVLWIIGKGDWAILRTLSFGIGEMLVLAAVASFAIYSILLHKKPAGLSANALLGGMVFATPLPLLPAWMWEEASGRAMPFTMLSVTLILFIALFPSLVATLFWNRCVAAFGPSVTGISFHLIAAYSAVLALIFLGEPIHSYHLWGIAFILLGVGIGLSDNLRRRRPAPVSVRTRSPDAP